MEEVSSQPRIVLRCLLELMYNCILLSEKVAIDRSFFNCIDSEGSTQFKDLSEEVDEVYVGAGDSLHRMQTIEHYDKGFVQHEQLVEHDMMQFVHLLV